MLDYDSTLPVTMDVMVAHAQAVRRGSPNAWLVGDMPYVTYQPSIESAIRNAGIDGMSHMLDRILYLLGTPKPVSVTARTCLKFAAYPSRTDYMDMDFAEGRSKDVPVSDCEDLATAFVQFEDGCTLVVDNARSSNVVAPSGTWFYGTRQAPRLTCSRSTARRHGAR